MKNEITKQLSELVLQYSFQQLPEDVVIMAKAAVLDYLGCMIKGCDQPCSEILACELGIDSFSSQPLRQSELNKIHGSNLAMLLATSGHAIDYDDTHLTIPAHIGSPVIGALLALACDLEAKGEDLITAIVVGYEIGGRVGSMLTPQHYEQGFHTTGTVSVFSAAAACAKLLNLNLEQIQSVLGLASTMASGIKCTFGTMAKPLNAGRAAASGLMAAKLVRRGFTAPLDAMEADKGYLSLFLGMDSADINIQPLNHYTILENHFKFHAACHGVHPTIHGALEIKETMALNINDIESVEVTIAPLIFKTASIVNPASGLDGKFSIPYVVALVFLGFETSAENSFTDSMLDNKELMELLAKVKVKTCEDIPFYESKIEVTAINGETHTHLHDMSQSTVDNGLLLERLEPKFRANAGDKLSEAEKSKLVADIFKLESLPSIAKSIFN